MERVAALMGIPANGTKRFKGTTRAIHDNPKVSINFKNNGGQESLTVPDDVSRYPSTNPLLPLEPSKLYFRWSFPLYKIQR